MESGKLLELLRPVRRMLLWTRITDYGASSVLAGLGAGLLLGVLGLLLPIAYYRWAAISLPVLGALCGLGYVLLRRRAAWEDAGKAVDAAPEQGQDAVVTALYYLEADSPIARLQRQEAVKAAESYVRGMPRLLLSASVRRRLLAAMVSAAVLAALLLLPNPMDSVVAKRQAEADWIASQRDAVEEKREELAETDLTEEAKQELDPPLASLKEGLDQAATAQEALNELEKAMLQLDSQADQLEREQAAASRTAETLQREPMLKQLGEQLAAGNEEGVRQGIEQLKADIAQMSAEQKAALAAALDRAAGTVKAANEALSRQLTAAASSLRAQSEADSTAVGEQLEALAERLAEAAGELSELDAQLAEANRLAAELAQAGQPMASKLAASGEAVQPAWQPGGLAEALAQAGAEAGTQAGAEAGTQAGAEAGAQAGAEAGAEAVAQAGVGAGAEAVAQAGVGAGAQAGAQAGAEAVAQAGAGAGRGIGSRDLVTTPSAPSSPANAQADYGQLGIGPRGERQRDDSAPAADGVTRPYSEVFTSYEAEAKQALERQQLPVQMQELVRQYFIEIQPEQE